MINPTTTTGQLWPLQSGSTTSPVLLPGKVTSFQFQDVPDRSPTGPLAYFMPGVELTFSGVAVQGAEGGAVFLDHAQARFGDPGVTGQGLFEHGQGDAFFFQLDDPVQAPEQLKAAIGVDLRGVGRLLHMPGRQVRRGNA